MHTLQVHFHLDIGAIVTTFTAKLTRVYHDQQQHNALQIHATHQSHHKILDFTHFCLPSHSKHDETTAAPILRATSRCPTGRKFLAHFGKRGLESKSRRLRGFGPPVTFLRGGTERISADSGPHPRPGTTEIPHGVGVSCGRRARVRLAAGSESDCGPPESAGPGARKLPPHGAFVSHGVSEKTIKLETPWTWTRTSWTRLPIAGNDNFGFGSSGWEFPGEGSLRRDAMWVCIKSRCPNQFSLFSNERSCLQSHFPCVSNCSSFVHV